MKDVRVKALWNQAGCATKIYPLDGVSGMWKVFKDIGENGLVTKSDVPKTIVNRMCARRPGYIDMAREDQQREAELPGMPLTGPSLKQRLPDS